MYSFFLDLGGEIMKICFGIFILICVLEDVFTLSPIRLALLHSSLKVM